MGKESKIRRTSESLSILKNIVSSEMCIGCGLCLAQDEMKDIKMIWNENGFLVPDLSSASYAPAKSVSVCPFNPNPQKDVRTEDELANHFLKEDTSYHPKLGRLINTYVGHSYEFRESSSSGGVGTYVIKRLLETNEVDVVFAVTSGDGIENEYQYSTFSKSDDLLKSSKTRYYPVSMEEVFKKLPGINGKVAVVGIPCFIKAIRLHQYYNPELASKIKFLIGIVCGGMKSRFFAEYLAHKSGVSPNRFNKPEFRVKDMKSDALDYSFTCEDQDGNTKGIKMRDVGDMWGTGYFKNNACDFCDDVVAELADISLGDAWIDPYNKDGRGTNIIITRSALAENIINNGLDNGELCIEELDLQDIVASQRGGLNHRQMGIEARIKLSKNKRDTIPPKRYSNFKTPIAFKLVQQARMLIRKQSFEIWKKHQDSGRFEKKIRFNLFLLKAFTKIYHFTNKSQR